MRYIIVVLILISAHFSLNPFAPGPAGEAKLYWPFAVDTKSWLGIIGGLPSQAGIVTTLLSGLSGVGFLSAALGLFWSGIPSTWWPFIVLVSTVLSIILYGLYFGIWSILPILVDVVLLWGIVFKHWTVTGLRIN